MQRTLTWVKITTKHVSNRPVTFVAHKRFAVLFVLPSCCVNSQICRAKSGIGSFSFTLTFSLSSAVTSRQVFVSQLSSAFIEKLFSRTLVLHANIFTNLFLHFLIEREYEKSMKGWFGFINNPTYTQIHTPTVVQGERVDGTPPRSFWYVAVSQRFGHPRVLGIPIPKSLAFWASPVGDAQNADRFDFA